MRVAGFALFEIIMVLALCMGCASLGFLATFPFKHSARLLDRALLTVLLHRASAQARLVKMQEIVQIEVLTSTVQYKNHRYQLTKPYRFGVLPDVYGPPSAPTTLVSNPITLKEQRIIAYPDGTLQSGTLYITDGVRQYALTLPVSAFSHIRFYEYRQKKWYALF